jgi:Tol biopolymer transport system component
MTSLAPGTKLGPYEIVAPLGAGGMGEVFRARDPRLSRDVAIKALPAAFAQDPDRLARFEREAKLLASLSHPNIAGILGIEEANGTRYLVLEFVDGETLDARIHRGALPLDDALEIARQVAAGVEAAHEAGIVHRDLKPGNVMITESGAVKVLDFGLAKGGAGKSASGSDPSLTASPTMTYAATQAGVILGTAAYMSPEQARGKAVDRRTDIWSFACVLYEMLSGRRVYDGETVSDMVARILEREPDWSALPASCGARLRALLRRCLTKDARQRQRDMGDVRLELEAIAAGDRGEAPATVAAPARRAPVWALALGALALLGLGALAATLAFSRGGGAVAGMPPVRFTLTAPPGMILATPAEADLSPDGGTIAFVVTDSIGINHVALRLLGGSEARIVAGTERATLPFWSPDGRSLGFLADGKLRKVALDGSAPTDLCDAPDGRGASWSRRGVIVFAPNNQGGLMRVSENGGAPVPLLQPDSTHHERGLRYPQFLPDGRHFLYVAVGTEDQFDTYAASLDGGAPKRICRAGSMARFSPPGTLYFLEGFHTNTHARLLAQAFDPGALRTRGDSHVAVEPVDSDNFGYANVALGPPGELVVQHWLPSHERLAWRTPAGDPAGVIAADVAGSSGSLSPDGRQVAYAGSDPPDLYVLDIASGATTRLTFANKLVQSIVWSPDGRRIAFGRISDRGGWEARVRNADGSGSDSLLFRGPGLFTYPQDWSRDGRWLVLRCSNPSGDFDIWLASMTTAESPHLYEHTPESEGFVTLSRDGHWLATTIDEGDRSELFVRSFPEPGSRYQIGVEDMAYGGWDPVHDAIIASDRHGQILRIDVSTANGFRQGATTRLFRMPSGEGVNDISHADGRFLTSTYANLSAGTSLEVLLGWNPFAARR